MMPSRLDGKRRRSWSQSGLVFGFGFFVLVSQTLLFRDFLSVFAGSELAIGCFFGSWLLWVAAGGVLGRILWRRRAGVRYMELVPLLYLPAFVLEHYLILQSRHLAGVSPYELFPLARMFAVTLAMNAPVSLLTGVVFTLACGQKNGKDERAVSRVYVLEAGGSFSGGVAVTCMLAAGVAAETAFLISACVQTVPAATSAATDRRVPVGGLVLAGLIAALIGGVDDKWRDHRNVASWGRFMNASDYQGTFTTAHAKYHYGSRDKQFTVLAKESITETVPNRQYAARIAALHLAQKPDAESVLVAGSNTYAVCRQFLELGQIKNVTWLHPDPAFPDKFLDVLPDKLRKETDRLHVPGTDIRKYLRQTGEKYDLAVLAFPDAVSLYLNRYYTREFFALVNSRLNPAGVAGVSISGGANYLTTALVNLGASVRTTLGSVFEHQVLKPGDTSWMLASQMNLLSASPDTLVRRYRGIPESETLYPANGLRSLYRSERIEFQSGKYRQAIKNQKRANLLNTDRSPRALFHALLLHIQKAGAKSANRDLQKIATVLPLALGAALVLYLLWRTVFVWRFRTTTHQARSDGSGLMCQPFDAIFLIVAAGLTGMAVNVVLMFLLQAEYGSLFLYVGLVSSLFMLGLFTGSRTVSLLSTQRLAHASTVWLLIAGHGGFLALLLLGGFQANFIHFSVLFFVGGIFTGSYAPVAAAVLYRSGRSSGSAGGAFETGDHLGGAAGAFVTGVALIPVLGFAFTLAFLAGLLIVGGVASLPMALRHRHGAPADARDSRGETLRIAGYALAGIVVFVIFCGDMLTSRHGYTAATPHGIVWRGPGGTVVGSSEKSGRLKMLARKITGADRITIKDLHLEDDGSFSYAWMPGREKGNPEGFVFTTYPLAENIIGYNGPVNMAVHVSREGVLKKIRVLQSYEDPAYFRKVRRRLDRLYGKNIFKDDAFANVDAVSGATESSQCVLRTLRTAGSRFHNLVKHQETQPGPVPRIDQWEVLRIGALALLFVLAVGFARRNPSPRRRRLFLFTTVVLLGILFHVQYASQQVLAVIGNTLTEVKPNLITVLALGVPLTVILAGNVYCGYLCPFGALQELIGELRPAGLKTDPPKPYWRPARFVKYALLAGMLVVFGVSFNFDITGGDPLAAAALKGAGPRLLALVVPVLVCSFFWRRFWCRNLCPVGAFLALLNGLSLLRRRKPKISPSRCDLGVQSVRDLDCLCCDRCRISDTSSGSTSTRKAVGFFYAAVLAIGVLFVIITGRSVGTPGVGVRTQAAEPSGKHSQHHEQIRSVQPEMPLGAQPKKKALESRGQSRDADIEKLRQKIRKGELSDKEARFYRKLKDETISENKSETDR